MSSALPEKTLSLPGVRFFWRMTGADGELLGHGCGAADFRSGAVATEDRFPVVGADTPEPPAVRTLATADTLYVLAAGGGEESWLAIETGTGGMGATVLAPLLWLTGADLDADAPAGEHAVSIDLGEHLASLDGEDRAAAERALEFGQVGLAAQRVPATVQLTGEGLVERLRVSIPPGVSPIVPVGNEGVEHELVLEPLDEEPAIPVPDAELRVVAEDYLRATLRESGMDPWEDAASS